MKQCSVTADYQSSPVLEYSGNPLIEAMPPILTEAQAAQGLAAFPPLPNDERGMPKEVRLHCLNRLAHLVQPFPIYLDLENAVSSILRSGYVGRNPLDVGTWRHLHSLSLRQGPTPQFNSTASTFSLVGLSGIGKTTALDAVLRLYPQVITHHRYRDQDFIHTQIVWLKLECPFDGSLSGLCHTFFRAVDEATGEERYTKRYRGKGGIQELIQRMEQVASTYFIGALFIDELQHLRTAKTGGKDNMLNFFINLINSIGIPVVFVGTNSMLELFVHVLRNARRASGFGIYDFKQPTEEDASWELLLKAVWGYQWVKTVAPLTPELKAALYDLTQGITDFLTKLMILGQRYAIQSDREVLDVDVFRHVANTKMKLLQPALDALRTHDPAKMRRFEDLLPPDEQLAEMMYDSHRDGRNRLAMLSQVQPLPNSAEVSDPSAISSVPAKSEPSDRKAETISIASTIGAQEDPLRVLSKADWFVRDPFEFVPTYREG